jgi:hypothetical protein
LGGQHNIALLNPILRGYKDGFEISEEWEILILSDNGLSNLFEADIPTNDKDISNKINSSNSKIQGITNQRLTDEKQLENLRTF